MKRFTKTLALAMSLLLAVAALGTVSLPATSAKAEGTTLTYWRALDTSKETVMFTNWMESDLYKWIEEETGVHVEFVHPVAGEEQNNLNMMIASGELTDIIERDFSNTSYYPGGVDKAIEDGVIIALNDAWDKGWLPNMKNYFEVEHPEWINDLITDNGAITNIPFIREDDILIVSWGPQIRMDWLMELFPEYNEDNLPSTIAEWDTVLRGFKAAGKCEYPLLCVSLGNIGDNSSIPGAYGVGWEWYLDPDGHVAFGPAQDAFRDFLTQIKIWIDDGIMSPDWQANLNTAQLRSAILADEAGLYFSNLGGGMGTWYDYINNENGTDSVPYNPEGFRSFALPEPTLEKGEISHFGAGGLHVNSFQAFITTACEDVEAACKYLDFGFSELGKQYFNYGKEGVSFDYINYADFASPVDLSAFGDKFPRWSAAITDNIATGHAIAENCSLYIRAHSGGPFIQDEGYLVQFMKYNDQLKTIDVWNASSDFSQAVMPRLFFTTEESEVLASKQTDLITYKDETITKFLTGALELNDDTWAEFQAGLVQMGLTECLSIREAAVQRAYARSQN